MSREKKRIQKVQEYTKNHDFSKKKNVDRHYEIMSTLGMIL